jgi:hypothetical protein
MSENTVSKRESRLSMLGDHKQQDEKSCGGGFQKEIRNWRGLKRRELIPLIWQSRWEGRPMRPPLVSR